MLEVVQELIFKVTGKTNVTYDTDFIKDLGLNSFDIMNLICAFEERFNAAIPTRDVWKMHQVKDVLQYMRERGVTL